LTLKFIGNINTAKEMQQKLREIKFTKFKLKLDKFGYFSSLAKLTALWVDVNTEPKLRDLQRLVDEVTLEAGDLNHVAHITLGRVKVLKDEKALLEKFEEVNIENIEFEVTSFKLLNSLLSKDGPHYSLIEEYKLN
jgi:2'-5' RNA ligase